MDARARNRALLARQMLLTRVSLSPVRAVERLVGMQAQTPRSPYTALWSRLRSFDPLSLSRAIEAPKAGAHRADAQHDPSRQRARCDGAASADAAGAHARAGEPHLAGRRSPASIWTPWRARRAGCSSSNRAHRRNSAPRWPGACRIASRARSRTPRGPCCRSCRSRRAACGNARARRRSPPPSNGWAEPCAPTRPGTRWRFAISARSGRRPPPISSRGAASPA